MMHKRNLTRMAGWVLLAAAVALFCMQLGNFYVQVRYHAEYVDDRIFYIVNVLCIVCIVSAIFLLLQVTKRVVWIAAGLVVIFVIVNGFLMMKSNEQIKNMTSISPDFKHVFAIKEDRASGEAVYFRSYFDILARPLEKLPYEIDESISIEWLAKDIAAFTYSSHDGSTHQFIGTYGSREGDSYNYVASEIRGEWEGEKTRIVSDADGISVTENGETKHFDEEHTVQFGTLAVVLTEDDEAVWTISLDENFKSHANDDNPPSGNITLYKASKEHNVPMTHAYVGGEGD